MDITSTDRVENETFPGSLLLIIATILRYVSKYTEPGLVSRHSQHGIQTDCEGDNFFFQKQIYRTRSAPGDNNTVI